MMRHLLFAATLVSAATLAAPARADFVVNGGFEAPVVPVGGYQTFTAGSTIGGGFTVTSGSVDVVNTAYFNAFAGNQSLDLDGSAPGAISETLTGLTAGTVYSLSFAYANNPAAAGASALVSVGNLTSIISHAGSLANAMNYSIFNGTFTAIGTSATLTFSSLDAPGSVAGVVLDAVSVNPAAVPEPSSLILAGLGLSAAGLVGVRRRAAV